MELKIEIEHNLKEICSKHGVDYEAATLSIDEISLIPIVDGESQPEIALGFGKGEYDVSDKTIEFNLQYLEYVFHSGEEYYGTEVFSRREEFESKLLNSSVTEVILYIDFDNCENCDYETLNLIRENMELKASRVVARIENNEYDYETNGSNVAV